MGEGGGGGGGRRGGGGKSSHWQLWGPGGHTMSRGDMESPVPPLQPSHLLCSDGQAGRHHEAWGLVAGPANKTNRPPPRTREKPSVNTRFWKVAESQHWSFMWLSEAPPALAAETPIHAHGSLWSHHNGKGKSVLFALQKLLCCSVTASPEASRHSPGTGTKLPQTVLLDPFPQPFRCKNSPGTTCIGPPGLLISARPRLQEAVATSLPERLP